MRRLVVVGVLVVSVAWLTVTAGPTLAQGGPNGTVTATVQVQAAACIQISNSTFSYTPAAFSTSGSLVVTAPNSAKPSVQSCSPGNQTFAAKGGNTTSGASWSLTGSLTCPGNVNQYMHEVESSLDGFFKLSTTDAPWESGVTSGSSKTLNSRLTMPCSGSTGFSQTVSIPIVITALVEQ